MSIGYVQKIDVTTLASIFWRLRFVGMTIFVFICLFCAFLSYKLPYLEIAKLSANTDNLVY